VPGGARRGTVAMRDKSASATDVDITTTSASTFDSKAAEVQLLDPRITVLRSTTTAFACKIFPST
jgi:hypothetical protein